MKKLIVSFFFCFISPILFSQITNPLPASASIASTGVSDTHNWSAFDNPANLGYGSSTRLQIQYQNKYLIKELSTKSIGFEMPTNLLNIGLSVSQFGYSQYHETMIGTGFARNFGDKFAMGLQVNYQAVYSIATNSYSSAILPQFGLSVKLKEYFILGFESFNPFQFNSKSEYVTRRIPSIFSLGSEYCFSPSLIWRTQIDKELSSNYRFATGFEYQMVDQLMVKLGAYGSNYLVPCMGLTLKFGRLDMGLNCELHPLLGLNSMATVVYEFGPTNK